jgi:electron transfer flavoprotein beta subunit
MHIVVLAKAVPNTAGDERLDPQFRLDRAWVDPIINPNDEHALEVALRMAETMTGVETTMLAMGPAASWSGLSKAIAAGIGKAVLVTDEALENACALSTAKVLAAVLRTLEFDLIIAGLDSSDGRSGVVAPAVATLLGVPFISHASEVLVRDGAVEVKRLRDDGYERLVAQLPALVTVTQAVGEFRYPTLRGTMAARSRSPVSLGLADLGLPADAVGRASVTTAVVDVEPAPTRSPTRVVTGDPATVALEVADFLAARRFIA